MADSLGIVLLAAGASRRMGKTKQLLPVFGKPLLQHVLDQFAPIAFDTGVLVLGHNGVSIEKQLRTGKFHCHHHPGWESGMASSLLAGMETARAINPNLTRLLISVADQPHLTTQTIEGLIREQAASGLPITCSTYAGKRGVPAIFHHSVFTELQQLTGDKGAGALIQQNPERVRAVAFPFGEIDLDTPEAYERILRGDPFL